MPERDRIVSPFRPVDTLGDMAGRAVLVRVDFNVPLDTQGRVHDDTRLTAALDTVQALRRKGARLALLSHFGRPDGRRVAAMSLAPVAPVFANLLDAPVTFIGDCVGPQAEQGLARLDAGGVALLENTRYHAGEEANDKGLARQMAALGDVFVNDAFSVSHRAHVSTVGLAEHLPAFAGLSMQHELEALNTVLSRPKRPVLAVVGGAKVSSKIDLLTNLVTQVDVLAIGGGMANTFLAARGHAIGRSLCEPAAADTVHRIEDHAQESGCTVLLPVDVVVAGQLSTNANSRTCSLEDIGPDDMILDAGPQTVTNLMAAMDTATTLIWNGPLGAFEYPPFDAATTRAARAAATRCRNGTLVAIAGGGDTVAALNHAEARAGFTHVSTAGGAFLEWVEGKALPGVEALVRSASKNYREQGNATHHTSSTA